MRTCSAGPVLPLAIKGVMNGPEGLVAGAVGLGGTGTGPPIGSRCDEVVPRLSRARVPTGSHRGQHGGAVHAALDGGEGPDWALVDVRPQLVP